MAYGARRPAHSNKTLIVYTFRKFRHRPWMKRIICAYIYKVKVVEHMMIYWRKSVGIALSWPEVAQDEHWVILVHGNA